MRRSVGFACTFILLAPVTPKRGEDFSRYKRVEAYEARPGVLIMPRFSVSGQVCEIAIEKAHYSPTTIDLDSTMPQQDFVRIIDELVPANERGRIASDFNQEYWSEYNGNSVTTFKEYENVSIKIYGKASSAADARDVAAVVTFKKMKCRSD